MAEVQRLFNDYRPAATAYMDSHANASSHKAIPTAYNYLVRVDRGRFRLCRAADPVHTSRAGARMWPDQADVDQAFWALWRKWSRWQAQEEAAEEVAPAALIPVVEDEDEVESDVHSRLSTYREAMLEHLLVGELMRQLWPTPLEVCKPQVDAAGYDLILQCRDVLRHVQLKTSFEGAATRQVPISVELGRRHGGCVIWTRFDAKTLAPTQFWWFGGGPGARPSQAAGSDGCPVVAHQPRCLGTSVPPDPGSPDPVRTGLRPGPAAAGAGRGDL